MENYNNVVMEALVIAREDRHKKFEALKALYLDGLHNYNCGMGPEKPDPHNMHIMREKLAQINEAINFLYNK
jgi:hypothetical protein